MGKPAKFKNKKLDASVANYSQVEISPGLFVKRPSSKTKNKMEPPPTAPPSERDPIQLEHKVPTVILEHNDEIKHEMGPESPQMPKLKTIDLKKIMKEKKVAEATKDEDKDEIDTPEMPVFQSDEGRLLSTKKIKPQKPKDEDKDEIDTPEMPVFQSD